uniref:14_3_3 domain-containing protein n=1 Tax=Heterorhabditis bacteriophora TaxID=37862 RepID=A0A1I7W761_HETBA
MTMRLKRILYEASRSLEKAEQAAENNSNGLSKNKYTRMKNHIFGTPLISKNNDDYYIILYYQVTEGVLRKGVENLEAVERQRLAHCQTALGRYQRKIEQLGPNLHQMLERHANNLDVAVLATASSYIDNIRASTSASNHIMLIDLYVGDVCMIIFHSFFIIFEVSFRNE